MDNYAKRIANRNWDCLVQPTMYNYLTHILCTGLKINRKSLSIFMQGDEINTWIWKDHIGHSIEIKIDKIQIGSLKINLCRPGTNRKGLMEMKRKDRFKIYLWDKIDPTLQICGIGRCSRQTTIHMLK